MSTLSKYSRGLFQHFIATVAITLVLSISYAEAARSIASRSGPSFFRRIGLGIASYENIMGGGPSLSVIWPSMDETHILQTIVSINETTPFEFGFGAQYKNITLGSMTAGFHIGGGISIYTLKQHLGSNKTHTFFNVTGTVGPHFTIPSLSRMFFSFDAGPMVTFGKSDTDLGLQALGPILGFSVHYLF